MSLDRCDSEVRIGVALSKLRFIKCNAISVRLFRSDTVGGRPAWRFLRPHVAVWLCLFASSRVIWAWRGQRSFNNSSPSLFRNLSQAQASLRCGRMSEVWGLNLAAQQIRRTAAIDAHCQYRVKLTHSECPSCTDARRTDRPFHVPAETKFSVSSRTIKCSYDQYRPIQTPAVLTSLPQDTAATCCSFPVSPDIHLMAPSAITGTN